MEEKNNFVTNLGKKYMKILVNSIYGSIPGGDSLWYDHLKKYLRVEKRRQKIKTILDDTR